MKNQILSYSILLSSFILYLIGGLILINTAVTIYWHIDPSFFSNIEVTETFKAGYGNQSFEYHPGTPPKESGRVFMDDLNHTMIYWIFFRGTFFMVLNILIIQKAIQLLKSIESLQTFYKNNIHVFKQLSKLGFAGVVFACFNFIYLDGELNINLTIPFAPLLFAMACLVMAEVFDEGRKLLEEQKLIV